MQEDSSQEYLKKLNPNQYEAVIHNQGPCMIIAGAGSGKTRVLTYRIARLICEHHVDPFNILALTFTNKAAHEMRERIEAIVGMDARNLWMGTFHAVFAKILRAEAHCLGYTRYFSIYDTDDSKQLIKQIVKEYHLDDKLYKPNIVLSRISAAKNRMISWEEYVENPIYLEDDMHHNRPQMGKLFETYVKRCFKADAMDFDDLLFNANILLDQHTDVLNKYQHQFHYTLIDEFQDTNGAQYQIAKKLSAVRQNICVVGDDGQSIYAFRGADIQNILNFERDFPELKIYRLEQNYRSSENIVNAANSVIACNKAQLKKNLWTSNNSGDLIEILGSVTDNEEGSRVASSIFEIKMQNQASEDEFVILYRTNSQSRAFEEALRKININYRVIGGVSFYQRREIKDVLAYLRFVINTQDEQALRRILNFPKRGIGQTTLDTIIVKAQEHDISLWEVIQNPELYLNSRSKSQVKNFAILIKSLQNALPKMNAYAFANLVAKNSGILKEWTNDESIEGKSRYENIQELLNAIKEFEDNPENEDKSIVAFMQDIALLTDADNRKDENIPCVSLMTVHMSKGLEFNYVFIVGLEEELFPSQMMVGSRADLEEERRLFYVAITRAKKKLFLTYALKRYRFGTERFCKPSRFLQEINPKCVFVAKKFTPKYPTGEPYSNRNTTLINGLKKSPFQKKPVPNHKPTQNFEHSESSLFKEGQKIEHFRFGFGHIVSLENIGDNRKAIVNFEHAGERTLILKFAKMRIVSS